jgi:hypothetical protein
MGRPQDQRIHGAHGLDVPRDSEVRLNTLSTDTTEAGRAAGIPEEVEQRIGHGPGISRTDEEAAFVVKDDLGNASCAGCDNGFLHCHSLDHHAPEMLPK